MSIISKTSELKPGTRFKYSLNMNGKNGPVIDYLVENLDTAKSKRYRKEYLKKRTVKTINGHDIELDAEALNLFNSVIALANAKYNIMTNKNVTKKEAYKQTYGLEIEWKTKQNKWITLKIEEIVELVSDGLMDYKKVIE